MKTTLALTIAILSMGLSHQSFAASPISLAETESSQAQSKNTLQADLEIDPIAYALGGYSLHAGLRFSRFRLDLGAFAANVPEALHGNAGFDASMQGFGAKLDLYLFDPQSGPFVGVEGALTTSTVVESSTGISNEAKRFTPSMRVGWMIPVYKGFYVSPWVGLGYTPGVEDRTVAGRTYEESPWVVFPTIHAGYRFE